MDLCESNVFLISGGKREMVMEDAMSVVTEGGKVVVTDALGKRKEVEGAKIGSIDMEGHEVLLERS